MPRPGAWLYETARPKSLDSEQNATDQLRMKVRTLRANALMNLSGGAKEGGRQSLAHGPDGVALPCFRTLGVSCYT